MAFRPPDGPPLPSRHSYEMTGAMTIVWMVAGTTTVWIIAKETPRFFPWQGFVLGFFPIALFGLGLGLQKGDLPVLKKTEPDRKQEYLWSGKTNAAEILAFTVLALPLPIALFTAPTGAERFHVATNLAAVLALAGLWIYII